MLIGKLQVAQLGTARIQLDEISIATAFLDHDQAALAREKALAAIDLMGKLRGVDGRPAVLSGTGRLYREAHRLLRGASHREFPKGAPRALGTPSP